MKITYHASFNFAVPAELQKELPMPTMNFKAEGDIDCTEKEYITLLEATTKAAKEAADAWRPVAIQIVKNVFCQSFAGFCSTLWARAKDYINFGFKKTTGSVPVEDDEEIAEELAAAYK